ncbi:major capsid protein [Blackfly microvirus SF02]|uniref:Major capsid protein n=1 Tax=Blackfly microvirus SF02 TaxID=2576452 RepID=A0A4P8PKE9_9VIRU|nr:major capsid protein [Blackfly microvirus SF02]
MIKNLKQQSVNVHDFAMNPRAAVPRSQFDLSHGHKTTFGFSLLIPILVEPVLPGDTFNCSIQTAARTAVPIVPILDNWHLEFFSFFIPMRLVWPNARKFWGEQDNPGDSISFTIPTLTSPVAGFAINSLYDYMGLPTVGQTGGANTITVNSLPFRCYMLVYNQWFRDENLQVWQGPTTYGDGPDALGNFGLQQRGKRFDYYTQALPWPQKGGVAISLPLGTSAPVKTSASATVTGAQPTLKVGKITDGTDPGSFMLGNSAGNGVFASTTATGATTVAVYPTNLFADLTGATSSTINQLRQAFTLQQYLEKDARGGTRYTEYAYTHFGVRSPDARLQRPEFIGGGHADINTTAIPQTSATGLTGGTTPAGSLSATGTAVGRTGFTYSSTEHGYIITLACARADLTYSQGIRRFWSVSTRYDWPVPLLANLGEQTLLNQEIYSDGTANDTAVFGYIPRWDEWRASPSLISSYFKSTTAGTLDYWHSSQKFTGVPTLNATFIADNAGTVVQRNFAAGAATANQQLLADFYFNLKVARALPLYGIPGLTRL